MNLQKILEQMDARVPNTQTPTTKVLLLNERQKQWFRDFKVPDELQVFDTAPGVSFYPLPSASMAPDTIKPGAFTVDGEPYAYRHPGDEADVPFWTIIQGQLFLYPEPTRAATVTILHTPRYADLSENNTAAVPSFPADYHMLYVYAGCVDVAELDPTDINIALRNNYQPRFDELYGKAREHLNRSPKPRFIRPRTY